MTGIRATAFAVLLVASLSVAAAVPAVGSHDGGTDCSFPLSVTDDTGTDVTLDGPAETVVAGDAASAQTFWEVGAADRVIGMPVRDYTEYLDGSRNRTDVLTDDGMSLDLETIVELDPDLVVAPNYVNNDTVAQLRGAGLTVYRTPFEKSFEDIYAKTELYAHFVGDCEAGASTANETRRTVESVREAVAGTDRPDVLYYFFGTAAGSDTFIGDMVETAGGINVAAEAGVDGFDTISDEVIVERDPEWIVTTDDPGSFDPDRDPFSTTTAVQNDQVLTVDANLVSQAGPRVVEPLRAMAEAFHPEAFANQTATEDGAAGAGDSEDDGTGFGVAVGVAALAAAGLLARRS